MHSRKVVGQGAACVCVCTCTWDTILYSVCILICSCVRIGGSIDTLDR